LHGPAPARPGDKLRPRQREVLRLLSDGYSMKEIARELKITARTVAFHKYSLMAELGIRSTAGLIQFASRAHCIPVNVSIYE
jgi:DNA-binding CsgD family transcriptional regulator